LCIGNDQTDIIKAGGELQKAISELDIARNKMFEENMQIEDAPTENTSNGSQIIGESTAIKYVIMRIRQVAKSNATVLLEGETGVGKEVIARFLHEQSSRSTNQMITVNCAAIPSQLLESELFGHEKGAFTGADRQKKGRFELASGGTLFLDEIGEMPLELQPKLLRVLQENEIERLGSTGPIKVDVRIIAATNRSLKKESEAGRFRSDLFYRLNTFPITIPPLRQRKQDIPLLTNAFILKFASKHGKTINQISPSVQEFMMNYDWPGNIRELQNVVEQSVILATGDTFKLSPSTVKDMKKTEPLDDTANGKMLTLEEHERQHILKALEQTRWKISGKDGAADILGINASTLRSRMSKLGISRDEP
jgi:transcriptional regulator with GAF, ATPase, and Fis domain